MRHSTWLEELVSQSNTIQAQEDITVPGRLQAKTQGNYVYIRDGFLAISQDALVRLGSRLAWHEILSVCIHGLQRGHPENPYKRD